jgi:hypothetical protein
MKKLLVSIAICIASVSVLAQKQASKSEIKHISNALNSIDANKYPPFDPDVDHSHLKLRFLDLLKSKRFDVIEKIINQPNFDSLFYNSHTRYINGQDTMTFYDVDPDSIHMFNIGKKSAILDLLKQYSLRLPNDLHSIKKNVSTYNSPDWFFYKDYAEAYKLYTDTQSIVLDIKWRNNQIYHFSIGIVDFVKK